MSFRPFSKNFIFSVPPDISSDNTSSDVVVIEGQSTNLSCHASGNPKPTITWKREDGEAFIVRDGKNRKRGQHLQFIQSVCHGFRIMNRDDYFWVKYDHFESKLHFFEAVGAVVEIGSEPKTKPLLLILTMFVQIRIDTHCRIQNVKFFLGLGATFFKMQLTLVN